MSGWHEQTMYGFDCESTGVDVFTDRIVQATITKRAAGDTDPTGFGFDLRNWLIDPGIEIPEGATKVHGITTAMAQATGAPPKETIAEIRDMVVGVLRARVPLVVFNAAYDLSILDAECARWGLPTLTDDLEAEHWHNIVDPCVLGRGIATRDRKQKGKQFTLPYLCEVYKVPFDETHDATADADGAVRLARAIAESEEHIASYGPQALHNLQRTWRRTRQQNLKRYFDEQAIEYDDIDPGWPLHTSLQTWAEAAT